jgi:hypothetical protein
MRRRLEALEARFSRCDGVVAAENGTDASDKSGGETAAMQVAAAAAAAVGSEETAAVGSEETGRFAVGSEKAGETGDAEEQGALCGLEEKAGDHDAMAALGVDSALEKIGEDSVEARDY